jgi:hypothetical protein
VIAFVVCAALLASGPEEVSVSHRRVTARDGAALALYRYANAAHVEGSRPILLIADFGIGRAVFDFRGSGLARWLAARGRVVYVAELRGQGRAAGYPWSPGDQIAFDFPAIADAIEEGPFDLIAHGWEGTLALAASTKELKGRVVRVVALNTPVDFAVPSKLAEALLSSGGKIGNLGNDAAGAEAFDLLFALGARIDKPQLAALRSAAFTDLGQRASTQLLQWMRSGDLALADGTTVKGRLQGYDRPTLLFLALADGWANPELCGVLRDVCTAKVTLRTFSKFEAVTEDYSHLSMLMGNGAAKDVFTPAFNYLNLESEP